MYIEALKLIQMYINMYIVNIIGYGGTHKCTHRCHSNNFKMAVVRTSHFSQNSTQQYQQKSR